MNTSRIQCATLTGVFLVAAIGLASVGASAADRYRDRWFGHELNLRDDGDRAEWCTRLDRLRQRFCEKATIHVGPAADGPALRLLERDFTLDFLDDDADLETLGPLVIGPDDLDSAAYVALLQQTYAAGNPIGITDAFPEDVQRLHQAIGFDQGCAQVNDSAAPLVALRQSGNRRQTQHATFVLLPIAEAPGVPKPAVVERTARAWLRERFGEVPTSPVTNPDQCTDSASCLITLANSTPCNWLKQNTQGDSVELNNNIWATRSFANGIDYYYVEQEAEYFINNSGPFLSWNTFATNTLTDPDIVPIVTQPSPTSTTCSTSITTGTSFSFGGNAGYQEGNGVNVTPVSVGMDISNSTTTNCPSTTITYSGNPGLGTTAWRYNLAGNPDPINSNDTTFVITNHWIWEIGFNEYGSTQKSIQFNADGTLDYQTVAGFAAVKLDLNASNVVPLPFDSFNLASPVVRDVKPMAVERRQQFTIEGSGLYPSLVEAVQLGGISLPGGNFTPMSDTAITVVVPNTTATGEQSVGVQTSQGQSGTNVKIRIER